jgi:hypothetical protein
MSPNVCRQLLASEILKVHRDADHAELFSLLSAVKGIPNSRDSWEFAKTRNPNLQIPKIRFGRVSSSRCSTWIVALEDIINVIMFAMTGNQIKIFFSDLNLVAVLSELVGAVNSIHVEAVAAEVILDCQAIAEMRTEFFRRGSMAFFGTATQTNSAYGSISDFIMYRKAQQDWENSIKADFEHWLVSLGSCSSSIVLDLIPDGKLEATAMTNIKGFRYIKGRIAALKRSRAFLSAKEKRGEVPLMKICEKPGEVPQKKICQKQGEVSQKKLVKLETLKMQQDLMKLETLKMRQDLMKLETLKMRQNLGGLPQKLENQENQKTQKKQKKQKKSDTKIKQEGHEDQLLRRAVKIQRLM